MEPLKGGRLKISFSLSPAETEALRERALKALAVRANFSGFRPGKVPQAMVAARLGEEAVTHEMLEAAVRQLYPALVRAEKLEVVGSPEARLVTLSPFSFALEVAKLPEVSLGTWHKAKVRRQDVKVDDTAVDKALSDLRESRATEVAVTRAAALGDKLEIDFEVAVDRVVIDGGRGTKYPLILGQGQLIPGFEDNLVGLQPAQEKSFELNFPKTYKPDLAGKRAQVKAKVLQVFERTVPELTDAFAASVGRFSTIDELRAKVRESMVEEQQVEEDARLERELMEALLKHVSFGELPEALVANELSRMLHEFEHGISERGLKWQDYLTSLGKTEDNLKKEFHPQAEKRVKVALLIRAFARAEQLEADTMAVDQDIAQTLERYNGDERMRTQLQTDDYRDYVQTILTNRRVVAWLKEKLVE